MPVQLYYLKNIATLIVICPSCGDNVKLIENSQIVNKNCVRCGFPMKNPRAEAMST